MSKTKINRIDENTYAAYVKPDTAFAVEIVSAEPPKFQPEDQLAEPKKVTRPTNNPEAKQVQFAAWGADNRLPNHLLQLLLNNNLAPGVMDTKDSILRGDDWVFYYEQFDEKGKITRVPFYSPEHYDFAEEIGLDAYLDDAVIDYNCFFNVFAKLSFGNPAGSSAKKITKITHLEAVDCRLSVMDPKQKRPLWLGVADWAARSNQEIQVLPMFDPRETDYSKLPQEFAVHAKKRMPGNPYYGLPSYIGAQHWIRHANKIPVWKTANMDNSANIKYHIQIPDKYFQTLYPEPMFTRDDRARKRQEIIAQIIEVISGADNVGKAFFSQIPTDPNTGKELPGWKIEAIPNNINHEAYSKDFADANSAILSSLGTDPVLSGVLLPGNMGAGSGSKERMAYEVALKKARMARNQILKGPELAMKINKLDRYTIDGQERRVYIALQDTIFQTLDTNPTGKQDAI